MSGPDASQSSMRCSRGGEERGGASESAKGHRERERDDTYTLAPQIEDGVSVFASSGNSRSYCTTSIKYRTISALY